MAVSFANMFMAELISSTKVLTNHSFGKRQWQHLFSKEHKQRRNKQLHGASEYLPSYNKIHGWDFRYWNNILGYMCIQGRPIQKALFQFLDVRTHFKPTETFQYTHFNSCHPPGVRKGFIKREALRLLRTSSSKAKFEEHIALFKQRLRHRGYPDNLLNMILSDVIKINKKRAKEFCRLLQNQYRPSMPDLKHILMNKWHLIQNQPRKIFKNPPLISCRRGRSLKDVLVRAKLWGLSISYLDQ